MILYISHSFFDYEAGNLCRLFFPYEKLKTVTDINEAIEDDFIIKAIYSEEKSTVIVENSGETRLWEYENINKDKEYNVTSAIYKSFSEFCSYTPAWGMLTGIHPVKLYIEHVNEFGKDEAERIFKEDYFVSEEKLGICRTIANVQKPSTDKLEENDFSLYISIPFCPTRCSYCSFVSQSIEKHKKLIEPYVEALLFEIEETARIVKEAGLRLVTAYMGGGTPTTLNAQQLKRVINKVKECFDMSYCREFTVEAGRPDTIDKEKLYALKECGITRISINPQTLQDNVLENIGRKHSAQDVIDAFILARSIGMNNINMDLIAGLEGDTLESFIDTLDKVVALSPENITVHSLALKRSAFLFHNEDVKSYHQNKSLAEKMIDYSFSKLFSSGYLPYYLYRQSRMIGNQENTGWAKNGTECEYNVYTMDETHTVIACGAGGVSKIKDPYSNRLERIFNLKYPNEYLIRLNEMIERKEEVKNLYEQFRQRLH